MKYGAKMGSGAVIYIPSFIKIGSAIQKLIGENRHTDIISLLLFFRHKGNRLIKRGLEKCNGRGFIWLQDQWWFPVNTEINYKF
jgi:hypothetical protein